MRLGIALAAVVTGLLWVVPAADGRQIGKKCKPATKANAKKKKCDLTEHKLFRGGRSGNNKVPYTGRVKGRLLKAGKYKAVFSAKSPGGTSKPVSVRFTFVR